MNDQPLTSRARSYADHRTVSPKTLRCKGLAKEKKLAYGVYAERRVFIGYQGDNPRNTTHY